VGSYEPLDELTNIIKAENTVGEALTRLYLKTYLPTLFMQEDKVSMAHSLESRMPLCDNELLDFSLSLSLTQKMNNGELKSIPRSVAKLILPDMILRQPKRGFPTPYHLWFKTGRTKEIIEDLLLSPRTRSRNIFKYEYLQTLIKKNRESNTSNLFDYERASKIYSIAIIELWFRTFIDQELPIVVV
jgi:asparagine synthase (glutamine-hydrolysing)